MSEKKLGQQRAYDLSTIIILLTCLIMILLGFGILHLGHGWGDDFAAYLMQSESILTGRIAEFVEHNTFTIENSAHLGPIVYPWGYPIILAPVIYIWGLNLLVLKLPNLVFIFLTLLCLDQFLKPRLGAWERFVVIALFAFNPAVLSMANIIQSDNPFLFFSTAAILFLDRLAQNKQLLTSKAAWFALIAFIAFQVRTAAFLLMVVLFVSQISELYRSRSSIQSWPRQLIRSAYAYFLFVILVVISSQLLPAGEEHYLAIVRLRNLFTTLTANIPYYADLFAGFFVYRPAGYFLLPFLFLGIARNALKETASASYILFTLGVVLVWPSLQGVRLIIPAIPFAVYLAFQGLADFMDWIDNALNKKLRPGLILRNLFWGSLVVYIFISSYQLVERNLARNRGTEGAFAPRTMQMYDYITQSTPPASIIGFYKPRLMRLMTERDSFTVTDCEQLKEVDFFVVYLPAGNYNQLVPDQVATCFPTESQARIVFQNDHFVVYDPLP